MKIKGKMVLKKNVYYEGYSKKLYSIGDTFASSALYPIPYTREYEKLSRSDLLELISIAKMEKYDALDLSNCGLTYLPDELWEIDSLKVLYLGNDDRPNKNHIKKLPEKVTELKHLEALSVTGLIKVDIPVKLKEMESLVYLDCYDCSFADIPEGLLNPNLTAIGINVDTEYQLKKLCRLKKLRELHIANSSLKKIPFEIYKLTNLRTLNIAGTNIRTIPDSMMRLTRLREFDFKDTPMASVVPLEMQSDTQTAIEIVRFIYNQQREQGNYYFNESKMIVVGQGDVGKSCLVDRLVNDNYENKESTEGIDVKKWSFDRGEKKYSLNIWDFGGQEIYHSTHQFFLTKRALYILVWDARSESEYGRIDYWLKTINAFANDSPIIIVINKCDITTTRVNRIDFKEYQEKYPTIKEIFEVSCKDNINIRELRTAIKKQASKLPINKERWIKSWHDVKDKLTNERGKNQYISAKEYYSICQENGIKKEEAVSLSKYLHDLGVILHFESDTYLRDTVILSPEWVTSAVYKILDSQETILRNRNGILKISDLPLIWSDSNIYPAEKYVFILKIMEKFDLCYAIDDEKYLIAELLENTSLDLPEEMDLTDNIGIIFKYDFMPAGILTRFIVKIHDKILKQNGHNMCWRKGVFLKHKSAYASVVMEDSISEKKISVKVSKNTIMDAVELLYLIRYTISELNKTYSNLNVDEYVPCNCSSSCTHLYKYNVLCDAVNKGHTKIQCYESFEEVDILNLLEGIQKMDQEGTGKYGVKIVNSPVFNNINTNSNASTVSNVVDIKEVKQILTKLQGDVADLMEEISGADEAAELNEQLAQMKSNLEALENCNDGNEVIKTGKLNRIKRLLLNLSDPSSDERKIISVVKNGGIILKGLIENYNDLLSKFDISAIPFSF